MLLLSSSNGYFLIAAFHGTYISAKNNNFIIKHEVDFIKNMGGDCLSLFIPPELCSKPSL